MHFSETSASTVLWPDFRLGLGLGYVEIYIFLESIESVNHSALVDRCDQYLINGINAGLHVSVIFFRFEFDIYALCVKTKNSCVSLNQSKALIV